MFTELGGLGGQVLLERLTLFLATKTQNMLQISLKFWKEQTSVSHLNFVMWPHEVVEWAGLDVRGVLALEDGMLAVVEGMTPATAEGVGEGAVGEFQKEGVAVVLTVNPGTGTYT